jgi:ribokinase
MCPRGRDIIIQMKNDFDLIAIGDTVVDTFIRLEEADETWDVNHHNAKLCLSFADKVPFEFEEICYAVGNAANAAVSASRLGLKSGLVSNVGDDQLGKDCLNSLHNDGVDTSFIKVNQDMKTNHHYVLWFHDDRTILIKHEEYQYELPTVGEPKMIYLSSLRKDSLSMYKKITDYLSLHPKVQLTFQPGVFDIKLGHSKLQDIYERSALFFCNVEEAQKILGIKESDIKILLSKMRGLGPKMVIITDGPKGAYAYDGKDFWFMNVYPDPKPPYERTGAGDAFSSTFTSAIVMGKNPGEALEWASVNAMSVVQKIGAQNGLLSPASIEEWLLKKPDSWGPVKI